MQLTNLFSLAALAAAASAVSVSFDRGYDNAGRSLTSVACSDGPNGLMTRYGWTTQGAVPRFPNIGGANTVAGWNSPQCGACYRLSYQGRSVNVLAVDSSTSGFNIALAAMNTLTGGQAEQLGRVEATVTQIQPRDCGL
ncbi:hypothetical protein S7711_00058 [Stachybotrys chartarum IBT 7711]|uniref:SnodProt1 n=1 Tax=Stachybotrys chartarum (strain CBS 109288 / IBT 7711) TaxID=1280523 RepID=A0A084B3B1_STACB|nr:hypothetical protein S7711_00058 [Stachybotrys chartarum IBT 7711]KFA52294.1 hypothetical protein S40293_00455 [Stachybotrys chartarum IBT 40293]KFA74626.1 hypothetical protein S40288_05830 [Stachybotrys chartarum IBT 40288]